MEFHKIIKTNQHNCTIQSVDEKGKEKICNGFLKEWMTAPSEVLKQVSKGESLFRCRRCGAVYKGVVERHLNEGQGAIGLPPQFPVVR